MIEILEDAKARSEKNTEAPTNFDTKEELSLIFDLIDAKHIRGEILDAMGQPRAAAMWGITLSGREYLSKLKDEREQRQLPAKLKRIWWGVWGFVIGVVAAGGSKLAEALVDHLMGNK